MAYDRQEAANKIIQAGLELVAKGLIARTWGNISARISDTEFLITPSGISYESLTPEKLVVCKILDCSYEGNIKPSSEKGVHAQVYKYRSDVNFIIHTHQLFATAVGTLGQPISGRTQEEKEILGDDVFCAKYGISSTKTLTKNVSLTVQKHPKSNAFFMRFHGALCLGTDDAKAFEVSETLEKICQRKMIDEEHFDARSVTGFPKNLDGNAIAKAVQRETGYKYVLFDASPAVVSMASGGKVYPMIDDMAQIAGSSFDCIESTGERNAELIAASIGSKSVIFVKGFGALCIANDSEELEAVRIVLEKNCLAGCYGAKHKVYDHLKFFDAALQRIVYVKKYSKLK